jgi:hypothetical protein
MEGPPDNPPQVVHKGLGIPGARWEWPAWMRRLLPCLRPLRLARIDIFGTEVPITSTPSLQLSLSWSHGAIELTWRSKEGDAGREILKDGAAVRFVFADDGHAVMGHELKMGDPAPRDL